MVNISEALFLTLKPKLASMKYQIRNISRNSEHFLSLGLIGPNRRQIFHKNYFLTLKSKSGRLK